MNEAPASQKQITPTIASGGVTTLNCRFERSNNFQSVFVVGAWGRISGHGEIILSMYNEVPELVSNAVYSMTAEGKGIGNPKLQFQSGSEGIVREIHVDLVLSLDSAKNIYGALAHWIKVREELEVLAKQNVATPKSG
jgi:hypothetical protein